MSLFARIRCFQNIIAEFFQKIIIGIGLLCLDAALLICFVVMKHIDSNLFSLRQGHEGFADGFWDKRLVRFSKMIAVIGLRTYVDEPQVELSML